MAILTFVVWPYRPRKKPRLGTPEQLRREANAFLKEYVHDTGNPTYSFTGLESEIVDQNESIATVNSRVADYSLTFFLRSPLGEYFMLLYRPGEKPYVKHIEHRMARIKFKARYVPPPADG
jgi:hypothetical protein